MHLDRRQQSAQPRPRVGIPAVYSPCPFWTKPINPRWLVLGDDDSDVSSLPTHVQLYSTEFPVGFRVTAFHPRIHGLMVSRYRGGSVSPLHLGGRNFTCTESQVIKDQWSKSPIPGQTAISGERIAGYQPNTRDILIRKATGVNP
jgi:hypothetical protein